VGHRQAAASVEKAPGQAALVSEPDKSRLRPADVPRGRSAGQVLVWPVWRDAISLLTLILVTVTSTGTVREWNDDDGIGVIDSADTPGGCWVHFSYIVTEGWRSLNPGDQVGFTYEAVPQDGYGYRAVLVWPPGVQPSTQPPPPHHQHGPSAAYKSTLTIHGRTEL
jgi:CspA family cold shock protein